jgi:Zn-dependent protease
MPTRRGSIRLFRLAGIDVYLHWAWFLAVIYFTNRPHDYSSYGWNVVECLSLFLIVLMHEFGHSLACRQVGGQANQIILWPLGGVAYVSPPQRPGAQLWSIAAGPLVNVMLAPILIGLVLVGRHFGWSEAAPDAFLLLKNICVINVVILVFNLMPVYPLDGGQILRSLLWFLFGRANSLLAASVIGFIGVAALIGLAVLGRSPLLGVMSVFILLNCWGGLMQARALALVAKMPRRDGFACPSCRTAPPIGAIWRCAKCGRPFDTFAALAVCPHCGAQFNVTQCLDCGVASQIDYWVVAPPYTGGQ